MLRIHFTHEDVGRIRIAGGPVPAWEVLLSLHALGGPAGHIVFGPWRAKALGGLDPSARLLLHLAPPRGYSPDFLTPVTGADVESVVDAVQSTARDRLRTELTLLAGQRGTAAWMRSLAGGDAAALQRVGTAMRRYHQRVLAPVWDRIHVVVVAERAARTADLLDGGVERLLANLHPLVRWEPPVLSVAYPVRQDLHLRGRGLLLIPSYFCWARPIALRDAQLDPVLVYPANRGLERLVEPLSEPHRDPLARLLGATRAAVLSEIATAGVVTGADIARRLRISPASASEHATVLRQAGLIFSHRTANMVWHMPTPLGKAVLDGPGQGRLSLQVRPRPDQPPSAVSAHRGP